MAPRCWGTPDRRRRALTVLVPLLLLGASSCTWVARVSVSTEGVQADGTGGDEWYTAISTSVDGRFVAFVSDATNLVPGDTNGIADVFRKDLVTGEVIRVSVATDGSQATGPADLDNPSRPSISDDGDRIAFGSSATDLVAGDTNGRRDVFVHDVAAGTTARVSVAPDGTQTANQSILPHISADGSTVVFTTFAVEIGDPMMGLFVHHLASGTTEAVDVDPEGEPGDAGFDYPWGTLSADGTLVVFSSESTNLAPGAPATCDPCTYIRDLTTSTTTFVGDGWALPVIADDGRHLVAVDVHGPHATTGNVVRHDLSTGTTETVTVDLSGAPSGLGVDTGLPTNPSVSADGRYVAFVSHADDLVVGDTNGAADIFVRDMTLGTTTLIPRSGGATHPALSSDGRYLLFRTTATDLVAGDTNAVADVFITRAVTPTLTSITPSSVGLGTTRVTIDGRGFSAASRVWVGGGVTTSDLAVVSPTRIEVDLTVLATTTPGPRTAIVYETGLTSMGEAVAGYCAGCLTVTG